MSAKKEQALELLAEGKLSRREIAVRVGVHPSTLARWLKEPEFLAAFQEAFSIVQCEDLQTIHTLLQGAYQEFLKRLSKGNIDDVSTLHLVQLMDRLHRQMKETLALLSRLTSRGGNKSSSDKPLLSEEEYHEVAEEILRRIRERTTGPQTPGTE